VFLVLNLNGKIHVTVSLATENNLLDPVGKSGPLNLVCYSGGLPIYMCSSSCPHHTDVPNSRTYRNDNCCDADVSLFDGLLRLRVTCFPPIPSCRHANLGQRQSRSSFDTYATQITDTKQIFELQLPLDRMEVAVHTSTEDCPPPPNLGHYPVYAV
jgi:hypothetical protein